MYQALCFSNLLNSLVCLSLQKTVILSILFIEFLINRLYCRSESFFFNMFLFHTRFIRRLISNPALMRLFYFKPARSLVNNNFAISQNALSLAFTISNRGTIRNNIIDCDSNFFYFLWKWSLSFFLSIQEYFQLLFYAW